MEQLLLQNQKIELAVSEVKIEEEISQTLEYTDDLMGQKIKIAKFLRAAKAQVKHEQDETASSKSAMKSDSRQITENYIQVFSRKPHRVAVILG